ncbi:MAG: hypothetical protein A3H97_24490 [Acidobacteria bacterium RIFCSPLOWO2_02_FULL_65_29]|nr:MAG: hypothetical protein A3H97_24490 [Acidobacteria bacterium RIFCSPLOWO2_02_FULL_65_29]
MASPRSVTNPSPADGSVEQGQAPRLTAAEVPSITGMRLKPHGAGAKLVNISASGLLTECTSRVKIGSTVAVLFEGSFPVQSVVGRIVRSEVASMGRDGVLRYHVAIAFNQPLAVDVLPASTPAPSASAPPNPLDAPDPIAAIAASVARAPAAVRNRW